MASVPLPPRGARRFNTACQFCIVGCGYQVYKWPVQQQGGPAPEANALGVDFRTAQPALAGTWISPNQHSVVTDRDGSRHNVVILPDRACHVNEGMASVRGGGLAQTLYAPDRATRARLATPQIDAGAGPAKASWADAVDLGARVVKAVIDRWGPHAVG